MCAHRNCSAIIDIKVSQKSSQMWLFFTNFYHKKRINDKWQNITHIPYRSTLSLAIAISSGSVPESVPKILIEHFKVFWLIFDDVSSHYILPQENCEKRNLDLAKYGVAETNCIAKHGVAETSYQCRSLIDLQKNCMFCKAAYQFLLTNIYCLPVQ